MLQLFILNGVAARVQQLRGAHRCEGADVLDRA
jgi:hypothetical protein